MILDSPGAPHPRRGDVSPDELRDWIARIRKLPAVRWEQVAAVRAAVKQGTLETEEALRTTVERVRQALEEP
jgi:uncharacterized protein (DUF885 family)